MKDRLGSLKVDITRAESGSLREKIRTAQAVVFDMDGVLVNSEKRHFLAHQKALSEFGVKIDKPFYIAHGVSTDPATFYAKAFERQELPPQIVEKVDSKKRQIYEDFQAKEGLISIKPAISLVNTLHQMGIPLAIASAVRRDETDKTLKLLGIDRSFPVIIAGRDFLLRNKPYPDIYLKAAELLGVSPADCIAIEDSGNGAAAATRAGMTCVVVPNEYTETHDFTGAYVLRSFADLEEVMVVLS
jgi:HAD superfamily hydrolase (TIGR01509 family)